jgi:hypothetical protein
MNTQQDNQVSKKSPSKGALTSETIFKYINVVIVLILLFCIKGFL